MKTQYYNKLEDKYLLDYYFIDGKNTVHFLILDNNNLIWSNSYSKKLNKSLTANINYAHKMVKLEVVDPEFSICLKKNKLSKKLYEKQY